MSLSNQELLERIDHAMKAITREDLGAAVLAPEKRDAFVRVLSEATPILDEARRIDMNSHTHDIDRVGFASRILRRPADDATERANPQFGTNTLESVEVMAVAGIKDDTLEDNIEREDFEDTLLELIGDRVGLDLEELFLQGDKDSEDQFLSLTDGWLKKAGNVITVGEDINYTDDPRDLFNALIQVVPKKYLRNRAQWRLYVHWDIEDAYREKLIERGTGLGDTAQTEAQQLTFKGIPVREAANMPEGAAMLVPPSNLVYGVYRDIRIEPDRQPKLRQTDFVVTMRVDCHFEDEDAVAVATGWVDQGA